MQCEIKEVEKAVAELLEMNNESAEYKSTMTLEAGSAFSNSTRNRIQLSFFEIVHTHGYPFFLSNPILF